MMKKICILIISFVLLSSIPRGATMMASSMCANDSTSSVIGSGTEGEESEDDFSASVKHQNLQLPDTLRPYTPSGVAVKDSRRSSSLYIIYKGKKYLRK